jgi:hypothetical protein
VVEPSLDGGIATPEGSLSVDGRAPDAESLAWIEALSSVGAAREDTVERLHGLLVRASRFEAAPRRCALGAGPARDLDELALQAADDALVAILSNEPSAATAASPRGRSMPRGQTARSPRPRAPWRRLRRVAGLDEVDRREPAAAARRQRAWEPMQTGIDRQRTNPRRPLGQRPTRVTAHLTQDGELLVVEVGDRGSRTDVGRFRGGGPSARAPVVSSDS